ncbi:MAG: peptidylprolyl isomerase [Candidatus Poribacteria bacterium]|nr:peptidylprolyl isomerase [Candidatus Poribacteria bacterium]
MPIHHQHQYANAVYPYKTDLPSRICASLVLMLKRAGIAAAIFVIACLVSPMQSVIAQDAQPPEPPAAEVETPDAQEEQAQDEENGSEQLNPETDTPEEGDTQPPEPPAEAETPDSEEQAQDEENASERLNPETDIPEEGMVIGDGDDMSIVDNFVQIHGNALIKHENVILRADHVWADFDENLLRASGNVHLKVGNEETYSDELIFNLETKKGIARNGFTYSDPWYFGGSEIFKIGEDRSYIRGATLTTCSLEHPHYYFSVTEVIVRMNQELIAKNIVLRIGGFPLFYFPAIRRDLRKGKIAKIIVKIGTDSYQGPYLSIIQPIARKRRYDGALLYDRSARRGQGYGFEGKYRFSDTKFQEIYIPIPPDVAPNQRTKLQEKAQELQDRLDGEYDRYWLKQLFLEYKITDADVTRAKEKAEDLLTQLQEEGADFAELAQRNSDHSDTRYDGGDLGFLARGEVDEEGEPKLDPVLEAAAFALQEGEISTIVQTEAAFHILKAEHVVDVYGEREIQLRRMDIAVTASDDTKDALRLLADDMLKRAHEGEPFEQLVQVSADIMETLSDEFVDVAQPTVSEVNEGEGLPLNEMESSWQSSVRRLKKPGDIIERRPITMPEGLYIFQLIRKEETPTFEAVAEEFEAEWETFYDGVMNPAPEDTEDQPDTDETTQETPEAIQPQETDVDPADEAPEQDADAANIDDTQNADQNETDDVNGAQNDEQSETEADKQNSTAPNQNETNSEDLTAEEDTVDAVEGEEDTVDEAEGEEGEETAEDEEALKIYRKHGFRGRWEDPSPVASEAQNLYAGDLSRRPIQTKKSFRLIKVDRKRTYRGDFYIYAKDVYSAQRQSAVRTGNNLIARWAHTHSIYTPWDNRQEGRRPISFSGRTELRSQSYKEEYQLPNQSTLNSFAILTYGTGLSTFDLEDLDENGNLKFSRETIGDITSRLEIRHIHDFTGEGTRSLQKLPRLTVNFSRMRLSAFPFFETLNNSMLTAAEKLQTEKPFLSMFSFPTLESTSVDLDIELGNFFREVFRNKDGDEERDVFLKTMDLGFDVRKQSTLLITPLRELQLNLNLNSNTVWHDRDQDQNKNILRSVFSFNGSATNTLFRIYNVRFIPGLRKLRHEIQSSLRYDYQPAVDRDENLYPFGPSTYFYERKRLTYSFNTGIEIKTRRSQSPHRIIYFDTRLTADFTEFDPLYERQFEPIESDVTIVPLPSRNLNMTIRMTHDPNPHPDDGKQFKLVGFRSNIRYTRQSWNVSIGSSFSKRHTARRAARSITATGRYRLSRNLEFNASLIYYPIDGQFYQQRLSMTRNLHDWNLRISWSRIGIKRAPPYDNVRQDFTFQVSLIQEPAVSMGVGYDATTETWGIRTLPAGTPYNAFGVGNSLGRSYF